MSIINVWGCSESGKSTLATKIALHYALNKKQSTILVCGDADVPTVPILFPNKKDKGTLGSVITSDIVSQEDIYKNCIEIQHNLPLVVLGYNLFDNKYLYQSFPTSKWRDVLSQLGSLAEYVVIDNPTSILGNAFSEAAFSLADVSLEVFTGTIKSIIYDSSSSAMFRKTGITPDNIIKVMRPDIITKKQPVMDIVNSVKIEHVIPYSAQILQQYLDGDLFKPVADYEYNRAILKIASEIDVRG